jgi:uncharacterized membrane protein (Fun14 family)
METFKLIKNIFVVLLALGVTFLLLGYLKNEGVVEAPEDSLDLENEIEVFSLTKELKYL